MEGMPKPLYESMTLEEMESDPIAGPVMQKCALEVLKSEDLEYFNREFSGELDEEGYLFKKDGSSSNTKPLHNIGSRDMKKVMEMAKAELQ